MAATPLTIITGFLGAGKTTLLNHILHANHGLKIAVLVNDFGEINIDAQSIVNVEGETYSLTNGCICCTIREDLMKAVFEVLRRPDPPDYLILETSGVSDPLEVALTLRPINDIVIDSILTVIDAEQVGQIDRQYATLAMNQVGIADIVILNKVDLADAARLAEAHRYIRRIMPNARVIEAENAAVPLPLILNVGAFAGTRLPARRPDGVHVHAAGDAADHAHDDHSLAFDTWTYAASKPMSLRALQRMIEHLPASIYRVKGIAYLADDPTTPSIVQVVGRRASIAPQAGGWNLETPRTELVFIGGHGGIDAAALSSQLDACLAENAPGNELERLTNAALSWLRRMRQPGK